MKLQELQDSLNKFRQRIKDLKAELNSVDGDVNALNQEILQYYAKHKDDMTGKEIDIFSAFECDDLFADYFEKFPMLMQDMDASDQYTLMYWRFDQEGTEDI